jgi:hypothetical protein
MGLQLDNPDETTRRLMVEELERDEADGGVYRSQRLSESQRSALPNRRAAYERPGRSAAPPTRR